MVGLTFALLRSQWTQALTVLLLAALAVGAAVAAPVYVDMAGRAVAIDDVAAAPASQRTISAADTVQVKAYSDDPTQTRLVDDARRRDFEHAGPQLLQTPGFATVFAASFPAYVSATADPGPDKNGSLEYRDDVCDHVVIVAGRCLAAPGEVIVTAERGAAGLTAGATAWLTAARYIAGVPGAPGYWVPDGVTCRLGIVGVYQVVDAADPYWGHSAAALSQSTATPVFTERRSVATCDHHQESQEALAVPLPGTLDVDRVAQVRADVRSTLDRARGRVGIESDIESLLVTIDRDRAAVARVPASAAWPLLVLCWFVLFLAIAYTAQSRRRELGIVKLRGVSRMDQWTLAAAESLTPVLAGTVAGYLLGHFGIWLYGRTLFGARASVALSLRPWPYAAVALAGAILAALVALRRDLAATATDLLRRVPARGTRWADLTVACLMAALAVAALAQLRGATDQAPGGLALLAPAASLMTLGLFCGAVLDPAAARLGAWSVHKGWLGAGVGALHVGRRRTASRLFAVVVVATGLLTFAATAADAAARQRYQRVATGIGAPRVLSVSEVHLQVTVAPLDGAPPLTRDLGVLRPGTATYGTDLNCAAGCRLVALSVSPSGPVDGEFRMTLRGIRQHDPDAALVGAAQLADWHTRDTVLHRRATADGLELSATGSPFTAGGLRIVPADTAVPLPVLDAAAPTLPALELANGERIEIADAATPTMLPRLGTSGVLADLEYLSRLGEISVASRQGEIWLGPAAPADAADRFRAAGLAVIGERRLTDELGAAARRPSAAGVRFLLVVAVLGLALGVASLVVAAGVERRGRAEELRALRVQGMSRRQVRRAASVGYAGVVGGAALLGWTSGAVVWSLTGDRLPLVDQPGPALALPPVPGLAALVGWGLVGWGLGAAVLTLFALVLATALARASARSAPATERSIR